MDHGLGGLRLPLLALALLAVVSGGILACSDDGGEVRVGGEAGKESASKESPQPAAESDATPPSGTEDKSPAATDEEYLRHVCAATATFQRSFEEATGNIKPTNAEDALKALVQALGGPLDTLANDLDKANPPDDLEQWHDDAVERVRATAKEVKETERADQLGRLLILQDGPFPKPPPEVEERLRKAAESVKECEDAVTFAG